MTPRFLLITILCLWTVSAVSGAPGFYKACTCKALSYYGRNVIHNFGTISSCSGIWTCSCGHAAIANCQAKCEAKVRTWACEDKCLLGTNRGVKIQAQYDATDCSYKTMDKIYECGTRRSCSKK